MLEGRDIICFCNDWDGDPLSKKHVMLGLARKNRILWANSIGNRNPRATGRDLRLVVKKAREFLGTKVGEITALQGYLDGWGENVV